MADGFLGRWARRKEAVRKGQEVADQPLPDKLPPAGQVLPAGATAGELAAVAPAGVSADEGAQARPANLPAPAPSLEDAEALTITSDFTRFARRDVDPAVRNLAMKKLFTDPHFNVMDRLDVYIDDYSKADPIPPEMLKELMSNKFLSPFVEEKKAEEETVAEAEVEPQADVPTDREAADDRPADSVAQSSSRTEHVLPPADEHADPDLRLQQDDAPGPEGPGDRPR